MAPIPFPLGSYPGKRGHESAGRLVNAFSEPLGPGAPAVATIKRTAGLRQFSSDVTADETPVTLSGFRGMIAVGNFIYAAFADLLVYIDEDGAVLSVGALSGTQPVSFSRNNKSPVPDIVVTTENASYIVTTTTITEITDGDLPVSTCNTFQDGYTFFGTSSGQIFASGLNDASSINSLDVIQLEAKPDGGVRVVSFDQYLIGFGQTSAEVFSNTANETGFPFTRIAVMPRGLAGFRAVAGFEDGFTKALIWVGDDNGVHVLSGFQPVRISIPDVDRDIEATADKDDLEILVYLAGGHAFAAVSGDAWSWEYNFTTQQWHERASYLHERWRATGNSCRAFGKWLVGDRLSGRILEVTPAVYDEVDGPMIWCVESAPSQSFPDGTLVPRADFNFSPGTGIVTGSQPMQTEPRVAVSWSDNGGLSWGNPLLRGLGPQSETPVVRVNRTGRTGRQGRRWRLEVSDAVYVSFMGGDMAVDRVRA
jgi:hypothetical protein